MKPSSWLPGPLHPLWCQRIQSILPATTTTTTPQTAREMLYPNTGYNSNLMSVINCTTITPPIKVTRNNLTLITRWCSWLSMSSTNSSRWINFLRRRLSNSKELPQSVDSLSPIRAYKISCQVRVRFKGTQDLSLCHRLLSVANRSLRLWLPGRCSSKPSSSNLSST